MTLQDILGLVQTIVVCATLVYLALQFRAQVSGLRSVTYSLMFQRADVINQVLIEHPEIAEDPDLHGDEQGSPKQTWVAKPSDCFCDMTLTLFEEAWVQRFKYRLLDDDVWDAWKRSMIKASRTRGFRRRWQDVRGEYQVGFASFLDRIVAESPGSATSSTPREPIGEGSQ